MFVANFGLPIVLMLLAVAVVGFPVLVQSDKPPAGSGMNPLVAPWGGAYGGVPPWDHVRPEHFPDAFTTALAEERADVEKIASSADAPTFQNTIEALERSGRTRDRVARLFAVATENISPRIVGLRHE